MQNDAKLLPCPFCGATPHRGLGKVWHDSLHGDRHQDHVIKCPHLCVTMTGSAEGVAERWNTRTPQPEATEYYADPGSSSPSAATQSAQEAVPDFATSLAEGQIMDGWVDDKTFIEPVSPTATPTSEAVEEAAKHALDACRIIDAAVLEGHDNTSDLICHLLEAVEPARAALRALKGDGE